VGYAKIEGEKISSEVADLLEIPNSDICIVLAHNFIELAVDLHIYQNHREIWNLYSSSTEKVKNDFPKIAQCLGKYLNLDSNMINNELNNLIMFLSPQNLTSKEVSVKQVVLPLIKLRFKKDVSEEKVLNLLMKAIVITKPTYQEFLNYATKEVTKNIISKPLAT